MAEVPAYTIDQLADLHLPGYGMPATLPEIAAPSTDWIPILSLSIFREHPDHPGRLQVLTGIRRNTTTHDGVVSTPTRQLPPHLISLLLEEKRPFLEGRHYELDMLGPDAPDIREIGTLAYFRPNYEPLPAVNGVLPFMTQEALTYKLDFPGVTDNVYAGRQLGKVSLDRVVFGFSYVDDTSNGKPLFEPLVMYGAAVQLTEEGAGFVPAENEKYHYMGWTEDSSTFDTDAWNRDVFRLAPAAGDAAVAFCARGLCLITTRGVSFNLDRQLND